MLDGVPSIAGKTILPESAKGVVSVEFFWMMELISEPVNHVTVNGAQSKAPNLMVVIKKFVMPDCLMDNLRGEGTGGGKYLLIITRNSLINFASKDSTPICFNLFLLLLFAVVVVSLIN